MLPEEAGLRGEIELMDIAAIQSVYPVLGDAGFRSLVEAFYRRVEADQLLRPIFPPDLAHGREAQYLFLRQYFGGPGEYSERYGHPRLRQRHMPFTITREARDAWLAHMLAAIEEVQVPEPQASTLREYFTRFSVDMINHPRGDQTPPFEVRVAPTPAVRRLETMDD